MIHTSSLIQRHAFLDFECVIAGAVEMEKEEEVKTNGKREVGLQSDDEYVVQSGAIQQDKLECV